MKNGKGREFLRCTTTFGGTLRTLAWDGRQAHPKSALPDLLHPPRPTRSQEKSLGEQSRQNPKSHPPPTIDKYMYRRWFLPLDFLSATSSRQLVCLSCSSMLFCADVCSLTRTHQEGWQLSKRRWRRIIRVPACSHRARSPRKSTQSCFGAGAIGEQYPPCECDQRNGAGLPIATPRVFGQN